MKSEKKTPKFKTKEIGNVMQIMVKAWPKWAESLDVDGLEFWGEQFEDINKTNLLKAVIELVRTSDFAPSIARVRSLATGKPLKARETMFETFPDQWP